jgi:hypothetical protein
MEAVASFEFQLPCAQVAGRFLPFLRYSDQITLLTVDTSKTTLSITSIGFAVAPITKTNHFLFHEK